MRRGVVFLICGWMAVGLAFADLPVGSLAGRVTDPSGAVLTTATITARNQSGRTVNAKTDLQGNYSFTKLPPGHYTITAKAQGFQDLTEEITIASGQIHRLDLSLQIAVQHKEVSVQGNDNDIDASNPGALATAVVIKGKDLDALSDDPDELEAQLHALAGPSVGPNGGQIYIDGFTGGKLPPKSSIREIRANQNPFSAEFDKIGYGRVEILTKPGSQSLHGRFGLENNNSFLDSRNPFLTQKPDYHSELYHGSLDGPVGKKASFFFAGERRNINDTAAVNAVILDSSFNPLPFNQAIPNPRKLLVLNPRFDYQPSQNNTLSVRYQWYDAHENQDGIGQLSLASQAFDVSKVEHDFQMSDTQILSPAMVNDSRFEYRRDNVSQAAQNSTPQLTVLGAFIGGGNSLGLSNSTQDHYELHDYISLSHSGHVLKFGGRLRATSESDASTQNFNGTFTFSSLQAYQITQQGLQNGLTPAQIRATGGGASQFTIVTGQPLVAETTFDAGIFFQDDWRVLPNATVSYGLRYESQNDIRDHADFAPRVGFAWSPGSSKKKSAYNTVLRAGAGIFYDRFPQNFLLQARRLNGVNTRQFVVQSPDFFPNIPSPAALAGTQTPASIYEVDPGLRAPYVIQTAVTVERKLMRGSTLSLTYLHSRGVHQFLSRNINAPLPGTFDPQNPASGIRPFGTTANIYQYQSEGTFKQNQLTANFKLRPAVWLNITGYYSLSYASSNTAGGNSFPSNQYDLNADYGRAAYDIRHRLFLFGGMDFTHGWRIVPFLLASSGHPFNITVGNDLNGDSIFNDRPAFATDLSRPGVVLTPFGAFDTVPLPGSKIIPPNFGTGAPQFTLNLRLNKTFALGKIVESDSSPETGKKGSSDGHNNTGPSIFVGTWNPLYTLRFDITVANLLNFVSPAVPNGNLNSPLFNRPIALAGAPYSGTAGNRQVNLQVQFIF